MFAKELTQYDTDELESNLDEAIEKRNNRLSD